MKNQEKIEFIKSKLSEFVSNGGDVNTLSTKDELYKLVARSSIFNNGKRVSLEGKFSLLGFPRARKRKSSSENIQSLHDAISEFVNNGGDVSTICHNDTIYKKVKNTAVFINGSQISVAEKFRLAGFPREEKYNPTKMAMNTLKQLDNFKDENGYVDSYRNNKKLNASVDSVAIYYNLPISLVITLLGEKQLKFYTLNIDRYDYIKTCLAEYISKYGSLVGIKQKDERLYSLLCSTTKIHPTHNGKKISVAELVKELGFGDYENNFKETSNSKPFNPEEFMNKYRNIITRNGNKINLSDLDSNDYSYLSNYLRRSSLSFAEFFAGYGVEYTSQKVFETNKHLKVQAYPFLDEMKAEVDSLLQDFYNNNPNFQFMNEEDLFKDRVTACQFVYGKYKPKILELFSQKSNDEKAQDEGQPS